jgi:conjugal transfer mating pair stabilization protein TraN
MAGVDIKMKKAFSKQISGYLLSFLVAVYPLMVSAQDPETDPDEMRNSGLEAQSFAETLLQSMNSVQNTSTGQSVAIPTVKDGVFDYSNGESISVQDLYPDIGTSNMPSVDDLQSLSNSGDDLNAFGNDRKAALWEDSNSESPTINGLTYGILVDSGNLSKPDLSNDPSLLTSRNVVANMETISQEFGDCSTSTTFDDITNTKHIADYKTCERVVDKSTTCTVSHLYDGGIIAHNSGPYNISQQGDSALQVWIGRIGDNYWSGNCSVYENETEFVVKNPDAITKVTLDYAKWDDHIQIFIGPPGNETKIYQGPFENQFPPETPGWCELKTSWEVNVNQDITDTFKNSIDQGDVVRFKIRVSVSGNGEGYARLRIDYDPEQAVTDDTWVPQDCIDAAKGIYDGFATGSVTCSKIPAAAVSTGCVVIDNVQICNDDLNPAPFPDIPPLCEQVTVDVDYDFYKGEFCFTDANGDEVCAQSGTNPESSCGTYESDPSCGFISQQCLLSSTDGTCYMHEETWDCGTDIEIPDTIITKELNCSGPVRCMGADCINPNNTQSQSFNRALASLHAAQFMTMDMNCVQADGTDNVTCEIFGGEPYECKVAVGGAADCCDVPSNVSPKSYLHTLLQLGTMTTSLFGLETNDAVMGAYHDVHDGVVDGVSAVLKPFTSYADNIAGLAVNMVETYYTQIFMDWLKDRIKEVIQEMIQELLASTAENMAAEAAQAAAADALAETAKDQATNQLASAVGSAVSVVGMIYTIYVVAMMVVQAIYACEEEEFMLASKKDVKACHKVGSYCKSDSIIGCIEKREVYCCYNSPLSRIINEQIQYQTGNADPWGTPEAPQCAGLDMSEVTNVDWTKVDLGEWTALLAEHDVLPNPADMDIDSITGSGNVLNRVPEDGSVRSDAAERALERMGEADVDEIRRGLQESTMTDPTGS